MMNAVRPHGGLFVANGSRLRADKVVLSLFTQVRNKRTKSKGALSPIVQRVITQLSVMSASRKQPKMLKLSREDLIKHQTIQRCWSSYQADLREKRSKQLQQQYNSMKEAMDLLEELNPELYKMASVSEKGKRFPLDLKVPTEYPPNTIWHYKFKKTE